MTISLAPFSVPIKNLRFIASAASGRVVYCPPVPDGLQRRKRAVFFPDSSFYQTGLSVTVAGTITDFEVGVTRDSVTDVTALLSFLCGGSRSPAAPVFQGGIKGCRGTAAAKNF